jgi:isopentenyl-diphosphate delta-isomerase type 1
MNDVSAELLDVVDINDQVIGVKTRGEIHAQGLMHRAVHILVFNADKELFLQKRSMSKDEAPGLWDSSAAGHVNSEEEYLECACREIEEELGIQIDKPLRYLFHNNPCPKNGMEHCEIYRYRHDDEMVLQASEIDEGLWIDQQTMTQRVNEDDPILTDVVKRIWKQYIKSPI